MDNYPANSNKARSDSPTKKVRPEKQVEKVIQGEVTQRKKSLGKRFAETFVGGDDAQSVFSYIAFDVLIPAAKDAVTDAVSQGVERMLFGEVRSRRGSSSRGYVSREHTSYNRFYSPRREEPRRESPRRSREIHNFDDFIVETRAEAQDVIDGLFELISEYEVATVADLYALLGQSGNFQDEKWGWTDIRGIGATRVKGGYLIDIPRPEPID